MTTTPSVEHLNARHVLAAIDAATEAAIEDDNAFSQQAKRDGTFALYLRALGLGAVVISEELRAIRQELASLAKATYSAGGV